MQLKKYSWPGNVREMENLMHRTVLLSDDTIIAQIDALSEKYMTSATSSTFLEPSMNLVGQTIPELEKSLIIETLHQCLGNKTQAARILGISIRTLRNKLHAYSQDEHEEMPQKEVACL
jgi:DNA-binding NtrC family response regulator